MADTKPRKPVVYKGMRLLPGLYHECTSYTAIKEGEIAVNKDGEYFKFSDADHCWLKHDGPVGDTGPIKGLDEEGKVGFVGPNTAVTGAQGVGGNTTLDSGLGLRYNNDKVKFGLIPGHWTRMLAQILTKGAKKYAPRNWEKGLVHSEILDSLYRHLDSFLKGERYDPETKCHHLGHVAWNALALMTMDLKGLGKADLPTDDDVKTMED